MTQKAAKKLNSYQQFVPQATPETTERGYYQFVCLDAFDVHVHRTASSFSQSKASAKSRFDGGAETLALIEEKWVGLFSVD